MNPPLPFFCVQSGSDDVDTQDAMAEIIEETQQKLAASNHSAPKGAMVFFDVEHDAEAILECLYQVWPELQIAGCSSYGEFNLSEGMQDGSIQVAFFCGEIDVYTRSFEDTAFEHLEHNCQVLLDTPKSPAISFLLFDTIKFPDFESALSILKQQAPNDHLIIGGGASDDYDFDTTTLIGNQKIQHSGCIMLHLCGDIVVSTSTSVGWFSHGDKGVVTKSSGNTLIEINHQPALNFYYDETGGVSPNIELPLAVFSPENQFIFNRANAGPITLPNNVQGVQLFGYIPEGCKVQVSSTDKDNLLKSIPEDVKKTQRQFPENRPVTLALFFSCVSRRAFLSTDVSKEAEAIIKTLPNSLPGMGFYTYGEVGKLSMDSCVDHHNNSLVYVLLG